MACKEPRFGKYDLRRKERKRKGEGGLWKAYFRRKWGKRYRPGKMRKAGKVMRLKTPNVIRDPRMADDRSEDRCCEGKVLAWASPKGLSP